MFMRLVKSDIAVESSPFGTVNTTAGVGSGAVFPIDHNDCWDLTHLSLEKMTTILYIQMHFREWIVLYFN